MASTVTNFIHLTFPQDASFQAEGMASLNSEDWFSRQASSPLLVLNQEFLQEYRERLLRMLGLLVSTWGNLPAILYRADQTALALEWVNLLQAQGISIHGVITGDDAETLLTAIRIAALNGYALQVDSWEWEYLARFDQVLTRSEFTFLQSLLSGETSKMIANRISRSHRTVESMREKLYAKFGVRTRKELLLKIQQAPPSHTSLA